MKIIKTNILLLVLLSLSNCMMEPVDQEHLYIWDSTEDKDIFFALATHNKNFNPSAQSLVEYARLGTDFFGVGGWGIAVFDNVSKNTIKKLGFGFMGDDSYKFRGDLDVKDNPLYDDTKTDKNKIEYYPVIIHSYKYGEGEYLPQKLYFRQDTLTDPIDVLSIGVENDTIEFQHTFVSPPEYAFLPARNRRNGKPL